MHTLGALWTVNHEETTSTYGYDYWESVAVSVRDWACFERLLARSVKIFSSKVILLSFTMIFHGVLDCVSTSPRTSRTNMTHSLANILLGHWKK